MKLNTTKALIATVLATAFAGVAATAVAQNAGVPADLRAQHMAQRASGPMDPAQHAEMQKRMQERMAERHDQRMERLKTLLQITPAQEAAFKAYVARTEPTPPKAPAATEDWSQLTTPQRLDKMQALHNERQAEMAKRIDATKSFYAQLTPAQQKSFDTLDRGFQRAGMKGEHRMGGQGGHGRHGGERHGMGGGMGCEGGPMPGGMGGQGPRS